MIPDNNSATETHPLFPSGEWEGFYTYSWSKQQHLMVFFLDFRNGIVTGSGADDVAPFDWRGVYDTKELLCNMIKHYATHIVRYNGYVDENGIWGTWHIGAEWSGGFHLWPKPGTAAEQAADIVSEQLPVKPVTVLV